jgi:hypothetical protein
MRKRLSCTPGIVAIGRRSRLRFRYTYQFNSTECAGNLFALKEFDNVS